MEQKSIEISWIEGWNPAIYREITLCQPRYFVEQKFLIDLQTKLTKAQETISKRNAQIKRLKAQIEKLKKGVEFDCPNCNTSFLAQPTGYIQFKENR